LLGGQRGLKIYLGFSNTIVPLCVRKHHCLAAPQVITSDTVLLALQVSYSGKERDVNTEFSLVTGCVVRLFHRQWSDGEGALCPHADVPVADDRAARLLCGVLG